MNSLGDWVFFIVIVLYPYWTAPALVLLNWLLTRSLGTRLSRAPITGTNLAISLLLFGPIKERGGGFVLVGDVYYRWYLDASHLKLDNVSWLGLLMLCAVSVVTTVVCNRRSARKTVQFN
jgi:hypothetical protein